MWMGQVKFFCTGCGSDMTESIRQLINQRCKELSIDPLDLGEKAREAANAEMLQELGEEPANPTELAFINATALLLLELAYSPALLCNRCRSPKRDADLREKVKLRLLKGGKADD